MAASCYKQKKIIPELLYGDLSGQEKQDLEAHLKKCASCRRHFEELSRTIRLMDKYERPDFSSADPDELWRGIEAGLDTDGKESERKDESKIRVMKPLLRLAVAAAILTAGIFIGRTYWPLSTGDAKISVSQEKRAGAVQTVAQTRQYLERSKILLLGIMHNDPVDLVGFEAQQRLSRKLISQNPSLQTALTASKETMLLELVQELEVILMQIANLEQSADLEAVEMIREGVRRQGILFKINIDAIIKSSAEKSGKSVL